MAQDLIVVQLDKARLLLAQARDAPEAKRVADMARAAEVYARRQNLSEETIRYAVGVKVDALARMGDFLKAAPKATASGSNQHQRQERSSKGTAPLTQEELLGKGGKKTAVIAQALADLRDQDGEKYQKVWAAQLTIKGACKQVQVNRQADAIRKEPPPLPTGPFRVIVADPPWSYRNRAADASHRAANPYPSMLLEDIQALPVAGLAYADSILWLWTTNAHLRDAFGVLDAWGFAPKTILTWVKDRMGTGDWLRGQTEHCLLAVRGRPVVTLTNQTTVLSAPARDHSRKPDAFYELVDALCPTPENGKLELFARDKRPGWVGHGNEV